MLENPENNYEVINPIKRVRTRTPKKPRRLFYGGADAEAVDVTQNNKTLTSNAEMVPPTPVITESRGKDGVMVLRQSGLDLEIYPPPPPKVAAMQPYRQPDFGSLLHRIVWWVAVVIGSAVLVMVILGCYFDFSTRYEEMIVDWNNRLSFVTDTCLDVKRMDKAPADIRASCTREIAFINSCCCRRAAEETLNAITGQVLQTGSDVAKWGAVFVLIALFIVCKAPQSVSSSTEGMFSEIYRYLTISKIVQASALGSPSAPHPTDSASNKASTSAV